MGSTGFFTGVAADDYDLPHPPLDFRVILLVQTVLCRAFEILREQGRALADADEDRITADLRAVIENNLLHTGAIPGFNRVYYEYVTRQAQFENYNGEKLAKAPDLCFKLRHDEVEPRRVLAAHDALFVECKPVDARHPAGSKYCDDGLIRFIIGDYGWAMQEGMMLAYVRDGRTIGGHLLPAMQKVNRMASLATTQLPAPCESDNPSQKIQAASIYASKHRRSFHWRDGKGAATEITIYHLWHSCA